VRDRQPDYLAVFPSWHRCFESAEFPRLLAVEVRGNITLGDDEIVLLATPWTRLPLRRPAGAPQAPPPPAASLPATPPPAVPAR
jgi:hypothetical protein